ncbi:hypothetical protein AA313_de0206000 [Arthrobotrys entomopaga]|nr:hypothetical protein AA313_de0206000 [Arthrobotrys entomopaga]
MELVIREYVIEKDVAEDVATCYLHASEWPYLALEYDSLREKHLSLGKSRLHLAEVISLKEIRQTTTSPKIPGRSRERTISESDCSRNDLFGISECYLSLLICVVSGLSICECSFCIFDR